MWTVKETHVDGKGEDICNDGSGREPASPLEIL